MNPKSQILHEKFKGIIFYVIIKIWKQFKYPITEQYFLFLKSIIYPFYKLCQF
jgi:hypothetical protein